MNSNFPTSTSKYHQLCTEESAPVNCRQGQCRYSDTRGGDTQTVYKQVFWTLCKFYHCLWKLSVFLTHSDWYYIIVPSSLQYLSGYQKDAKLLIYFIFSRNSSSYKYSAFWCFHMRNTKTRLSAGFGSQSVLKVNVERICLMF